MIEEKVTPPYEPKLITPGLSVLPWALVAPEALPSVLSGSVLLPACCSPLLVGDALLPLLVPTSTSMLLCCSAFLDGTAQHMAAHNSTAQHMLANNNSVQTTA